MDDFTDFETSPEEIAEWEALTATRRPLPAEGTTRRTEIEEGI